MSSSSILSSFEISPEKFVHVKSFREKSKLKVSLRTREKFPNYSSFKTFRPRSFQSCKVGENVRAHKKFQNYFGHDESFRIIFELFSQRLQTFSGGTSLDDKSFQIRFTKFQKFPRVRTKVEKN